jgi:hypothetical protein
MAFTLTGIVFSVTVFVHHKLLVTAIWAHLGLPQGEILHVHHHILLPTMHHRVEDVP